LSVSEWTGTGVISIRKRGAVLPSGKAESIAAGTESTNPVHDKLDETILENRPASSTLAGCSVLTDG
jgi:hypothetical protein